MNIYNYIIVTVLTLIIMINNYIICNAELLILEVSIYKIDNQIKCTMSAGNFLKTNISLKDTFNLIKKINGNIEFRIVLIDVKVHEIEDLLIKIKSNGRRQYYVSEYNNIDHCIFQYTPSMYLNIPRFNFIEDSNPPNIISYTKFKLDDYISNYMKNICEYEYSYEPLEILYINYLYEFRAQLNVPRECPH